LQFCERFATFMQTSRDFARDLHSLCKRPATLWETCIVYAERPAILRETCIVYANALQFCERLATFMQNVLQFCERLAYFMQTSRKPIYLEINKLFIIN
jgi:hypothetical protein